MHHMFSSGQFVHKAVKHHTTRSFTVHTAGTNLVQSTEQMLELDIYTNVIVILTFSFMGLLGFSH